jgi:hypothetical protein
MAAAFIEHRPHASSEYAHTSHFVVIVEGAEVGGSFPTQVAAKNYACQKGYEPVHVASIILP